MRVNLRSLSLLWAVLALQGARGSADEAATIFEPGLISAAGSSFAPSFSPSSAWMLFSRKTGTSFSILFSKGGNLSWSVPVLAPFSGRWADLETAISPDGKYLIFASDRPIPGTREALRLEVGGHAQTGGNLWRIGISGDRFGEPVWLPASINQGPSTWTPSIAANGDLYFMSPDRKSGRFRLHRAPRWRETYGATRDLIFSTGASNDVDPMIDPRERFLLFSSDRVSPGTAASPGPERLFITFNPGGATPLICPLSIPGWEDRHLTQIEARLGDAGHTLYFASNRPAHGVNEAPGGSWDDGKSKIWRIEFNARLWAGGGAACADHAI